MSNVPDLETKRRLPDFGHRHENHKELAKLGMAASLGVAVFTTPFLKRNRLMRKVHTGAGVLLVGFSLWHHRLYQPAQRPPRRRDMETTTHE